MKELFPSPPPPKVKAVRKGPIIERIEQLFRETRYGTFTMVELYDLFPDVEPDTIRNALRKLLKERIIKSTGEVRLPKGPFRHAGPDTVCLTITIGK